MPETANCCKQHPDSVNAGRYNPQVTYELRALSFPDQQSKKSPESLPVARRFDVWHVKQSQEFPAAGRAAAHKMVYKSRNGLVFLFAFSSHLLGFSAHFPDFVRT